jgi:hypothetical protein
MKLRLSHRNGHMARMRKKRNSYGSFVGNLLENVHLEDQEDGMIILRYWGDSL